MNVFKTGLYKRDKYSDQVSDSIYHVAYRFKIKWTKGSAIYSQNLDVMLQTPV